CQWAFSARAAGFAAYRRWQIEQRNRRATARQREYGGRASRQHHGHAGNAQDRRTGGLRHSQRIGERTVNRREFLAGLASLAVAPPAFSQSEPANLGFKLIDVTSAAGIQFRHNSGAHGGKLLPETLGSGCAFLDYDNDGWQDILLVNAMDWPKHKRQR